MISPLAYVDPSAKIGKNVTIHPFAYIDKNVEIGDDNVIMPNASIMSGARIGNGNTIYNGAWSPPPAPYQPSSANSTASARKRSTAFRKP